MSNFKIFLGAVLFYIFVFSLFIVTAPSKMDISPSKRSDVFFYSGDSTNIFYLEGGTFPVTTCVIITEDLKEAIRYINFVHEEDSTNGIDKKQFNSSGLTATKEGFSPIIWLPKSPKTVQELSTMVHEVSHAASYTLEYCGVLNQESTTEVYAYQVALLTEQFLNQK